MTDVPAELPSPRDDDDDDVAWALQTAQVQWQRGAHADALTWLRRAADSAIRIGATGRAWDLKLAASKLAHLIPAAPQPLEPVSVPLPPSQPAPASAPLPPSTRPPASASFPPSTRPPASASFPPSTRPPASASFPPSTRPPASAPLPPSTRPPASAPFPQAGSPASTVPPRSQPSEDEEVDALLEVGDMPSDVDLYDDGTDIIDVPDFASGSARAKAGGARPHPAEVAAVREEPEEIEADLLDDSDDAAPELITEVEEVGSEAFESVLDQEEIEDEPASLLSEIESGESSDDELEHEPPSLFSEQLESADAGLEDASALHLSRQLAEALEIEDDRGGAPDSARDTLEEVEEEPTHKLRVDELAESAAVRTDADSLADELAPSLAPSGREPTDDLRPSLADELEPDEAEAGATLRDLAQALSPGSPRKPPTPQGSIDWDDEAHTNKLPRSSPESRPRSVVPPSISPRAKGVRRESPVPGTNSRLDPSSRHPLTEQELAASAGARAHRATSFEGRAKGNGRAAATKPSSAPAPGAGLGVSLLDVRGLQDLPEEAQAALAESARTETLDVAEELNGFAVALVLEGKVSIMPAIADAVCAEAAVGDVVFTHGHLADGVELRVVASVEGTRVAYWNAETLDAQSANCPWVEDDLKTIADRFQALAGAAMGSMGDRLDDNLRAMVTDRCQVMALGPKENLLEQGEVVNGMYVVGAGHVELVEPDGSTVQLHPGDFLFAAQVMGGGVAPATARAGNGGALLLRADRMAAHELLVSVPPLLEILAG